MYLLRDNRKRKEQYHHLLTSRYTYKPPHGVNDYVINLTVFTVNILLQDYLIIKGWVFFIIIDYLVEHIIDAHMIIVANKL